MSVPGQQRPNPSPLCLLSPPQGVSSLLSFLWQRGLHAVGGSEQGAGAGQVRLINIQDVWHPSSLRELLGASTPAWARMPNLQWGKVEGGSSLSGWTCLPQSWAPRSGWIGSSVSTQKRSSELQVNEKGGVSGNVLFKPQMIELGAPPHWFWGSARCGHLWRGGEARCGVGRRAPSARARLQSGGRLALAESPPAPGQPLPRCRSPAGPTPSPAAPSGRRGPARPSRAPALICCGRGGATASSGAVPERGREGKGEKCSAPEARSALLVRPRGRRRTSLERSAHGERVAGRRRRRGGGQKEAGEVRASEPSGVPAAPRAKVEPSRPWASAPADPPESHRHKENGSAAAPMIP